MAGRYADFEPFSLTKNGFTVSGVSTGTQEVFNLTFAKNLGDAGVFKITLKFGPQGRYFDADLEYSNALELALGNLKIPLGDVDLSDTSVTITIAGRTEIYSRDALATDFVADLVEVRLDPDLAAQAAEVVGAGMDAFALLEESFGNGASIASIRFAPSDDFNAKFEEAGPLPDIVIPDAAVRVLSTTLNVIKEVDKIETFGDNIVRLTYTATGSDPAIIEVYLREDGWDIVPPELAEVVSPEEWRAGRTPEAFAQLVQDGEDLFFTLATLNYAQLGDGPASDGLQYSLDPTGGVQQAFTAEFNFAGDEAGVVDGTLAGDTIDASYLDADGDAVSQGADTIRADQGDDTIRALGGDDEMSGGRGDDLLDGGMGEDTAAYAGAADGFIFAHDGGLTITDINTATGIDEGTDQLVGIEEIGFGDGTRGEVREGEARSSVVVFDDSGTIVGRHVVDVDGSAPWSSFYLGYDADSGALTDRVTRYDDGRVLDVDYADGIRSAQTMTDTEDAFAWEFYTLTYGADGQTLTDRVVTYDDGRVLDVEYAAGLRTAQTVQDVEGAHPWEQYTLTYGADGQTLTDRVVMYDDGRVLDVDYSASGIRTQQVTTDTAFFGGKPWETITQTYGPDGVTLTDRVVVYDDGRVLDVDYTAAGVRSQQVTQDLENANNWTEITQTYGADGVTLTDRIVVYDDGRVLDVDYLGGVRTQAVQTDVADAYDWQTYTATYDENGDFVAGFFVMDEDFFTVT